MIPASEKWRVISPKGVSGSAYIVNINKILADYTSGSATLEETNAALAEFGAGYLLDPDRNVITDAERTTHGLLDTGTLDKVEIADGHLMGGPINEVQADGSVNMAAYVYFNGKRYDVRGDAPEEA